MLFVIFLPIINGSITRSAWAKTRVNLSLKEKKETDSFLEKYKNNAIVKKITKIIDFFADLYDKIVNFMNSFLGKAIKSNQSCPINYF